jgi:hypothetical protein
VSGGPTDIPVTVHVSRAGTHAGHTGTPTLPFTGAPVVDAIGSASVLLALGAALVTAIRRRPVPERSTRG